MKKKLIALVLMLTLALTIGLVACDKGTEYEEKTFSAYEIVHQGYVGEAVVTVNGDGTVKSAELNEYLLHDFLPKDDGTIFRVKDDLANPTAPTGIKGYFFYRYNATKEKWLQYNYNTSTKAWTAHSSRDIIGTMSGNPKRMADYVAGGKGDINAVVTVAEDVVTVGTKASTLIAASSYKTFNKTDKGSGYMPLNASSIGYRYNALATVTFFMANPTKDMTAATLVSEAVVLTANSDISNETITTYTATTDSVWHIDGVSTGATWTDMPQYLMLLQQAYHGALGLQRG